MFMSYFLQHSSRSWKAAREGSRPNRKFPMNSALHPLIPSRLLAAVALGACGLLASQASAEPPKQDPVLSPFGIGSSAMRAKDHPVWIPQMVEIGIQDLRSPAVYWGGLEPEKGAWAWETLDQRLAYLESQGVTSGALLIGMPKWNTQDPRGGLPLNSLPEWSEYVRQLAAHTKGRVKHFEVWNEPPNGTKNAPASDYAKVVAASYDAAKQGNPEALVGLAAKSAHITYLDQAVAAGAKGHFDYITLHPYEILGSVIAHPGCESIYMHIAPTVRKMLAARDPEKKEVPIWFTEIGYDSKRGADKQAEAVIKAYVMGIAQGIACINWFEGIDGDSGPLGLLQEDGTPRPAYRALGALIRAVGRHPEYLGWVLLKDKHYGFVFQGPQGPVMAAWAATAKPEEVDFGQAVRITDPATGTGTEASRHLLATAPILVEGLPAAWVAQAKENRAKPFPWDGDYSKAKSVSVTMGARNVEKGLHTQSAETIAADVVAYGGNARAGSVPGGNVFMVDPNFLSYDTVPVEITAVVRRNAQNEPAKLELEYESASGYKKPPAFAIPDNADWHTATWKLDDVQFVGTWAFNFRFNSGSYYVQSVTVTRLDR
jgi:hypothetical protein